MSPRRLLLCLAGLACVGTLRAAAPAKPAADVQINFDHPENFTDVRDSMPGTERGRDEILANIRTFMVDRARDFLPAGLRLTVTFTDIDLAGDFEPWRGPQWDDVRIVKSIYPPGFKFSYSVTDAAGKVVKQGTENIRDLMFDSRLSINTSDPLHYEKDILSDWMRSTLRDLPKG